MSCKTKRNASKSDLSDSKRHFNTPYCAVKPVKPKKIVSSKKLSQDGKSCSTGIISVIVKPKKTTKSDVSFSRNIVIKKSEVDYCNKCGDMLLNGSDKSTTKLNHVQNNCANINHATSSRGIMSRDNKSNGKSVKQYYKNENYKPSSESVHEFDTIRQKITTLDTAPTKKISALDTIRELPEKTVKSNDSSHIFRICSDSDNELSYLDTDNLESIKKLKEFRLNNYFECHSATSRIKSKGNVTSLNDHKCVYRFYLNERLFPVPLSTDHQNNIRCVECHLPLNLRKDSKDNAINGTIQAKIRIDAKNETQDVTLLLPIKEPLIIKEKRKQEKVKNEVVYFGVIKLNAYGNSSFNKTLPDSLALKYQKGYKEYIQNEQYVYNSMDNNDVIIL